MHGKTTRRSKGDDDSAHSCTLECSPSIPRRGFRPSWHTQRAEERTPQEMRESFRGVLRLATPHATPASGSGTPALLDLDHEVLQVGGTHAWRAGSLSERKRLEARKPLPCLE